jgi:hypothetical protein
MMSLETNVEPSSFKWFRRYLMPDGPVLLHQIEAASRNAAIVDLSFWFTLGLFKLSNFQYL